MLNIEKLYFRRRKDWWMDHNINRFSRGICCGATEGIFLFTGKSILNFCVESIQVYKLLEIIHCCNKVKGRTLYYFDKKSYQYKAFIIETSVSHLLRYRTKFKSLQLHRLTVETSSASHLLRFSTKFKSLQVHRLTENTSSVSHLLRFSSRYKTLQPRIKTTFLESLLIDTLAKYLSTVNSGLTDYSTVCQILGKTYIYNFKVI